MNDDLEGLPGLDSAEPPRPPRFPCFRAREFRSRPPRRDLVAGLIPERALVCISGQPTHGKSLVALHLAWAIATGTDAWGRPTQPGPVLYCDAEGGDGMARREAALAEYFAEDDADVLFIQAAVDLGDDVVVADFVREHVGTPWAAVIFDTYFSHVGERDDNARKDFKAPAANMRRIAQMFQCAVIVLDHSVKPDKEGKRPKGPGGTGQKSAHYDAGFDVRCRGAIDQGDPVFVECWKMKDGAPPATFTLYPETVGPSVILATGVERSPLEDRLEHENFRRVLQALHEITQDGTPARTTVWQRYFVELGGSASTFYRWRAEVARGRLVAEGPKGWLLTAGGQALTLTTTPLPPHSHESDDSTYSHHSHPLVKGESVGVKVAVA